jgi:ERCC4-type nuclease
MIFEIDNREPEKLKKVISENVKNENIKNENSNNEKLNYEVVTKNLELGDFVLRNAENNILVIIERKSINDLLASVKDSRYYEQCNRLKELEFPSNKIYFIIEGNLDKLSKNSIEYKTVYSCIFSISYKNGFSILFTKDLDDTIKILYEFINRIVKYENEPKKEHNVSHLIKKQNIKSDTIGSNMLSLIPGISLNTSKVILSYFDNSIYNLMKYVKSSKDDSSKESNNDSSKDKSSQQKSNYENEEIEKNKIESNEMKIESNEMKMELKDIKVNSRKISKTVISNIYEYLMNI